jgi:ribosomal protein L16 Arg81 hydroxylase
MPSFAEFIAPFDPVEFKRQYFGQKPCYIRRAGAAFDNPLPWPRFNAVLGLGPYWNEDSLKVFYRSRSALRENYCDVTDLPAGAKAPADPRKVKALLGLGASLVANHIHKVCPEVAAITQMLEREFAARAGANVYCSFSRVQAFTTHFDLHDVFVLQTEGEKLWHVYTARADNPVAPVPPGDEAEQWLIASRGDMLFEVTMKPGDILYLPRGQYHDAITGAGASLHATCFVDPATGLSLFKLLSNAVTGDSAFRAYVPDARDEVALRNHLARLSQVLHAMMNSPAFAIDVLNFQRGLATSSADYVLPAQQRPRFYSPTTRVNVIRRLEGCFAVVAGRELPLGATYPAVLWLLQQRTFSLDDLMARYPFVDPREMQAILQNFLRAGIVVETEMS